MTAMWQATGVTVTAGQTVSVTATGTWTSGSAFTADGDPATTLTGADCPLAGAHLMALVGRIGPTGTPFLVGARLTVTAPASGQLYLAPERQLVHAVGQQRRGVGGGVREHVGCRVRPGGAGRLRRRPAHGPGRVAAGHGRVAGACGPPRSTTRRCRGSGRGATRASTTCPSPADYDGDGLADPTVWRGATGLWLVLKSSNGYDPGGGVSWLMGTPGGRLPAGEGPMSAAAVTSIGRCASAVRVVIVLLAGWVACAGVAEAQTPPETVEYYATDALGSVRIVFNAQGAGAGALRLPAVRRDADPERIPATPALHRPGARRRGGARLLQCAVAADADGEDEPAGSGVWRRCHEPPTVESIHLRQEQPIEVRRFYGR